MYDGQHEKGIELAQHLLITIMEAGWTWDVPIVIEGGTRARQGGLDYYQNLMHWTLPAVLSGGDLTGPCKPSGLIDRIIRTGNSNS